MCLGYIDAKTKKRKFGYKGGIISEGAFCTAYIGSRLQMGEWIEDERGGTIGRAGKSYKTGFHLCASRRGARFWGRHIVRIEIDPDSITASGKQRMSNDHGGTAGYCVIVARRIKILGKV